MRTIKWGLLAVLGIAACGRDATEPREVVPTASVRFVNAVPDTMAMDYRFVDFVTNAGLFGAAFRANQPHYQPLRAGPHTFRVFLSSSDPAIASTVVHEQAFTFAENASYTVVHSGFMRGGPPAGAVSVQQDNAPVPAAGRVGLRVLHLGAGMGAVDVFVGTTSTAGQTPSTTPTWTNVAFGQATPYVEADTAALRVAATATGTTTPLLVANTAAPAGSPASGTSSAIAGVRIAGSVLTVVILPPSVPGSMAPQTAAFTVPAFAFLNDRRPPN
ncbi:MAG: DUF4397 domain-containing protein [bacterium]